MQEARATFVVRMWLPDRPGALGQVASRIGAVRGEIVGIEILERGAGRAIDELAVELPDERLVDLLVQEVQEVDGVDVEEVRLAAEAVHDPRLDALEAAAVLVGATTTEELLDALLAHAGRVLGAQWCTVVDLEQETVVTSRGPTPEPAWLAAFVEGSRSSARVAAGEAGPDDVVWAPLPSSSLALILGRDHLGYRARERRQVAALARIVDTRVRELNKAAALRSHPSSSHR
ncbi:MAG: hypothetical protein AB7L84_07810 [Acidimicrobiia bacterium]